MSEDSISIGPADLPAASGFRLWLTKPAIKITFSLIVVGIVGIFVWSELHRLDWHAVRDAIASAQSSWLLLAGLFTLLAILTMGFYDLIAFPAGVKQISGLTRWWVGVFAFAWSNLISIGGLAGPAIRFFAYRRVGLSDIEVAQGVGTHYVANIFGLVGWLLAAYIPLQFLGVDLGFVIHAAIALSICIVLGFLLARFAPALNRVLKKISPESELVALQGRLPLLGLVSFCEWTFTYLAFACVARAVLGDVAVLDLVVVYFPGIFAGLVSMVPAGVGVADAIWLQLLSADHPLNNAGAVAVLYRVIYYVIPWLIAALFGYIYLSRSSKQMTDFHRRFIAVATSVGAVLLLVSAATPPVASRFAWLLQQLPVPIVEFSHIASVAIAVTLLYLARGLWHGYRTALVATAVLLLCSILANLTKGADYEEGLLSLVLLVMLLASSAQFTRRGNPSSTREMTALVFIASSLIFLFFGIAGIEDHQWFSHAIFTGGESADSARFMRGFSIVLTFGLLFTVRRAMAPADDKRYPSDSDLDQLEQIARTFGDSADALLVGCGDKAVWLWQPEGKELPQGGVLYQLEGNSMVICKDPIIHPQCERDDLLRELISYADELDIEPVFAMVSANWMSALHDFGYRFVKFTQEAQLPLPEFTLVGGDNAFKRRAISYCERNGVHFSVEQPPHSSSLINQCRTVSDAWLNVKGGAELQFSNGYFSACYLQRNPIAVARKDGEVIAFLNLLITRPDGPATFDFMRYKPDIVNGLMDYVIVQSALYCQTLGCSSFSLGGAPLSGVGEERSGRWLERILRFAASHAEEMYNYQGLYQYKSKFDPEWEPRYLAYRLRHSWIKTLYACIRVTSPSRSDKKRIAAARAA
ncbi:MAG: phosphatidylglycerol lysyltransferase domain-containing protein [Pseudomonadales bacterium]